MVHATPSFPPPLGRARSARSVLTACTGLALLLSPAGGTAASAQAFSLDEVLSAPFPDGLVGARDAEVVAWVSNDRGVRNVWVARGPDWAGEQVTFWSDDDGQTVGGLELAPDGSWIVFSRGGAPNRQGWTAAPAHPVEGAERTRWLLCLTPCGSGGPVTPGDASGAGVPLVEVARWGVLSPDGAHMAWTRGGRIEVVPFSPVAMNDVEATPVATVREGAGQLTWSPDGRHIAFVSSRGQHALVGVAAADGNGVTFVAPGVTRDRSPVWSPDGTRIAFLRSWAWMEPEATLPFFARPADPIPWAVVVAEVNATPAGPSVGRVRTVFTADPGDGSRFVGVSAAHDVWWTADDRLVFPWEKEGWKRLWSVPAGGGEATLLTPGEHVVQHAALAPDGRTLVFDSNRDDLDRKHVWAVRSDASQLRELTPGDGIEWAPVPLPSGAVAFLGSGATMPARPFVLPAEAGLSGDAAPGAAERIPPQGGVPPTFPGHALVVPESVTFPATDGQTVYGQLFLPRDLRPGERRPAVLFFHGGSRRQMLLGFHNRGYYHNAYAMNQYLAALGYVVLAVNYRSGVGYGLHFREAETYGAGGASEVRDVIGAALWVRARPDVDPERVGSWGGSYGGFLTAQGLVHAPELFAAGVDIHGVHDWNEGIQNFVPDYEPENLPAVAERAFQSSPMAHIDRWEDPVLLIHGDDDRNVRFTETVSLARELTLRGVPHDVLVLPDEVHGFLMHRSWLRAYAATAAWFGEWLNP
jgi:dipeptidyl aminopeptidase/acylaminoacyl peptidase